MLAIRVLRGVTAQFDYEKDSRALAEAIRAQVRNPFEAIAFLDLEPYYGLNFYLLRDVEAVFTEPPPATGLWRPRGLRERLKGDGETRLWVVPASAVPRFTSIAGGTGYDVARLGGWNDLILFHLLRPDPPANGVRIPSLPP
jgi:hypothetical protein